MKSRYLLGLALMTLSLTSCLVIPLPAGSGGVFSQRPDGQLSPVSDRTVEVSALESAIANYTNQERQQAGLNSLSVDVRLGQVARSHSQDMSQRGYFDHNSPDGRGPSERAESAFPGVFQGVGENISQGPVSTISDDALARDIVTGWMNSPGHRANILKAEYRQLGVGVYQQGQTLYATQVFSLNTR